jgi:hypothetical protein
MGYADVAVEVLRDDPIRAGISGDASKGSLD